MSKKFGIGMSQREAENFWRELVIILIGVPFLIIISVMIIDQLLQTAADQGLGFTKYFLYIIGFMGWLVAIYKKYMAKILEKA